MKHIVNVNERKKLLIIGYYESYEKMLNELRVDEIYVIGRSEDEHNVIKEIVKEKSNIKILDYIQLDRKNIENLVLADEFNEIVILSEDKNETEDVDM